MCPLPATSLRRLLRIDRGQREGVGDLPALRETWGKEPAARLDVGARVGLLADHRARHRGRANGDLFPLSSIASATVGLNGRPLRGTGSHEAAGHRAAAARLPSIGVGQRHLAASNRKTGCQGWGLTPDGGPLALRAVAAAYRLVTNHANATLIDLDEERGVAVVGLEEVRSFPGCYDVGILEGAGRHYNPTTRCLVRTHSISKVDLQLTWVPTEAGTPKGR